MLKRKIQELRPIHRYRSRDDCPALQREADAKVADSSLSSAERRAGSRLIVMVICHYDNTNPTGGVEKQARELARRLKRAGWNVVVLSSTRKWSRRGWTDDSGVPVRLFWSYHSPQISGRYLPAALIWAAQVYVWLVCHRSNIALVHGHQIRIHAFAGASFHWLFGIPLILKSATGGPGADIRAIATRKYFGRPGRHFIVANTSRFIATTASIVDDLRKHGVSDDRIRPISNGVETESIAGGEDPQLRSRRAVFMGRVGPGKNAVPLAQAALAECDQRLSVDFFGRGSDVSQLRGLLGASTKVRYNGFVEEPHAVWGQFGYLLLPSTVEGLSNAMIEAMMNGVVPVATRVSGCTDHIVPGVTGFFFSGTDVDSLRQVLSHIKTIDMEEWQYMSNNVAQYARDRFDIKNITAEYERLYSELIK